MSSVTLEKALCDRLKVEEGFRQFPYWDCCGQPVRACECQVRGKLTIGHGRNLEDVPLSVYEAELMVLNDIHRAVVQCRLMLKFFDLLDVPRQVVLADMAFNMGIGTDKPPAGLLGFVKMLEAVRGLKFDRAALEMLDSKWARQVGSRAAKLAAVMRTGVLE